MRHEPFRASFARTHLLSSATLALAPLLGGCAERGARVEGGHHAAAGALAPCDAGCCEAAPSADGGLDATAARLRDDVTWLADDARAGRRAGTPEAREAGEWIAARFAELGLEPAGDGGYLQRFTVPLPTRDGGASAVRVLGTGAARAGAQSVAPLFCSENGAAEGPLAFAGYGIVNAQRAWDDYGAAQLDGAIALIVRGAPPVPAAQPEAAGAAEAAGAHAGADAHGASGAHGASDPHGASGGDDPHGAGGAHGQSETALAAGGGWGSGASLFSKVMEAKRRGAVAVIVAQHPDAGAEPPLPFDAGRPARAGVPALMVSAPIAEALWPGYADAVRAIDAQLEPAAATVAQRGARVRVEADVERAEGPAFNVLARIPGESSERTVVVGAHYDHLGHGDTGSLAPDELGTIHNGADDNASGTAVVLELARVLASRPEPPPTDVVLALWSGEELGLLGSEHWARNPTFPLESVAANLNLDMVGRAGAKKLQVLGAGTSPAFAEWMDAAGAAAGLQLAVSLSGQGLGGSDHQTFLKRGIPALHLFSGVHGDYHRPTDDVERFEAEGAARVAQLSLDLVARMQAAGELPYAQPEVGEQRDTQGGFRARFGSIPDYVYGGKGVMLAGTSPDSPAERAGLYEGDLLVAIGDVELDSIYDMVYALQVHKPGDVVLVRYVRDGEERDVRVTLTGPTHAVE